MNITLQVWRQESPDRAGRFVTYQVTDIEPDMSFLEMLDVLNERLIAQGEEPIAFDHDCREGICGSCGVMIDGLPHGPQLGTATCQLHMRKFRDGDTIVVEPWRAAAFPVIRDLVVDRSAFDKIIEAGGYISVDTGSAPDANLIPVPKEVADTAFDAAACIGCGACVAACPNGAANLFTAAKVAHLNLLPQGQAERWRRTEAMVETMEQYCGSCTNHGDCEKACPKGISIDFIAMMNRAYPQVTVKNRRLLSQSHRAPAKPAPHTLPCRRAPNFFTPPVVFTKLAVDKGGIHGDDGGEGADDLSPPPGRRRLVVVADHRRPQAHRGDVRVHRLHLLPHRRPRSAPPAHPPGPGELRVPHRRRLQRPVHHARHDDDLPRRHAAGVGVHELPVAAATRSPRRRLPPPQRPVVLDLPLRRDLPLLDVPVRVGPAPVVSRRSGGGEHADQR